MVDSMITLYSSTEMEFTNNGIGNLSDATSCYVVEERNGIYELELEYPITGIKYHELELRRIIFVKPNPYSDPQPFRVYSISKPIDGLVTVNAEHISYDLNGIPVSPFEATSASSALVNMRSAAIVACPFNFYTDKNTVANMSVTTPSSIRYLLGGSEGSILDTYKGEYEFDRYTVYLWNNRGSNRGVSIRYGKNLTDLEQEENCSSVYTGVYPFWYSEEDGLVEVSGKIVPAPGTYNFIRIAPLDLSSKWQEKPTATQVRDEAVSYMNTNNIGIPKISITVSFVQLAQSEEYKNISILEKVHLCDTVNVEFPELQVSATAKCISTTYNVLTDKYKSIELGDAKSNLSAALADKEQEIEEIPSKSFMEKAIENATKLITGGLGGFVVLHSSSGGSKPDEILIMNKEDKNQATQVWRWNKNGLGYSKTGYNGDFGLAMTIDGSIVANYINVGILSGIIVRSGDYVQNVKGILINLSNGVFDSPYFKIAANGTVTISSASIPSRTNQLINDSDFKDRTGVTQIIGDEVTTGFVDALGITARRIVVSGLFDANANTSYLYLAGWLARPNALYNGIEYTGDRNSNSTGMGTYGTDWAFWAGNGRFSVKQNGSLTATLVTMIGSANTEDNETCRVYSNDGQGYTNLFGKGMHVRSSLDSGYIAMNTNNGGALTCFGRDNAQQVSLVTSTGGVPYVKVAAPNGGHSELTPSGVQTGSKEEYKDNILLQEDLLSEILNTDIYQYNLKSELNVGVNFKRYGFIIGKNYNISEKIVAPSKDGVDLYSSIGVLWGGVKELVNEISNLKKEIEELKRRNDG